MKVITKKNLTDHSEDHIKSIYNTLPKNLIVLSHLRWDFVFQRPQHLITRLSKAFNVFFIEEPVYDATGAEHYTYHTRGENLVLVVPHIKPGLPHDENKAIQKRLFDNFMENRNLAEHAFWYYTPMALEFSSKYLPELTIYDCMDELSAFKFAPEELKNFEKELLAKADVVFTGGHSLYEAKKNQHANIHPFPSSIEKEHFAKARTKNTAANSGNERLKLGFYGVIDERFDIELIRGIADARPDWDIELIGPVVKIDPATLPQNDNIHYLGSRTYQQLPEHLATWDIALIPFMLNESTRFISPTKTPEYLAAGKRVISTPIKDVVNPYGIKQLVEIGSNATDFVAAAERILKSTNNKQWLSRVDAFLVQNSWDKTCSDMLSLMTMAVNRASYKSFAQ